jgi:hypothetical protein
MKEEGAHLQGLTIRRELAMIKVATLNHACVMLGGWVAQMRRSMIEQMASVVDTPMAVWGSRAHLEKQALATVCFSQHLYHF